MKQAQTKATRIYWWPDGAYNGERIELNAAIRRYRLKTLPKPEKFEAFMEALASAWKQDANRSD